MTAGTSLALLHIKCEPVVLFEEALCHAGVARARGEAGISDGPRRLHVASNVGRSRLEELHVVLLLKRPCIVHGAMHEEV